MKRLSKRSGVDSFSRIYVENKALEYPRTKEILKKFKHPNIIEIDHYKNVFNRPRQNFVRQKAFQNLILAVKDDSFLYEGPDICESFGNDNFYYASAALNCIYDCHYCYLQGMYQSANIVIFVNLEDFFVEVDERLNKLDSMYLSISYDTDLLALEGLLGYSKDWINFTKDRENLTIELRTKSANYVLISDIRPYDNVILAFTLSPEEIIEKYEIYTAPLNKRIDAICRALDDGWQVRLSLEPIIGVEGWEKIYRRFIQEISKAIPMDRIYDINIGVFRMSSDYYKRIGKRRLDTDVFALPIAIENGVACFKEEEYMKQAVAKELFKHYPGEKIYL